MATGGVARRGRVLLVAALVGLVAGALTAYLLPGSGSSAAQDPLGLGVPLADLGCTGRSVLVVGAGDTAAPLAAAVADNPGGHVRYLRTADSCDTAWGPSDQPAPAYVAYLGPYAERATPCAARMSVQHKGDSVTRLRSGNTSFVKCICELSPETFPVLSVGMATDPATGIWVRALQGTLVDIDPARFTQDEVTGVYDARTAARIRPLQAYNAVDPNGVVDAVTWRLVRDRACGTYDY
ncbi:MAG: peptidoglycan-binding domain-containing protein [Nocardioides sp.]